MYRDNQELVFSDKHNFVLNHGALGDAITSLPAIIHARRNRSDIVSLLVWCGAWQMDLFAHLLAPYGKFHVRNIADMPRDKQRLLSGSLGPISMNAPIHNTATRNRVHMVDFAFLFLTDSVPSNMNERSYPVLAPLGPRMIEEKYVVFPVGATSDNRIFKAAVMAPIMEWVLARGYKPVLTGTKTSHTQIEADGGLKPIVLVDDTQRLPAELVARCIDLREKTTLLELRDVLGHAEAVIGTDGGTIHLAGTTDTHIVYALTTTQPRHRYIPRFGNPHHKIRYVGPRDLECAGCQSNWVLVQHHDFRRCPYEDNLCTDRLHPDDFINALKEMQL